MARKMKLRELKDNLKNITEIKIDEYKSIKTNLKRHYYSISDKGNSSKDKEYNNGKLTTFFAYIIYECREKGYVLDDLKQTTELKFLRDFTDKKNRTGTYFEWKDKSGKTEYIYLNDGASKNNCIPKLLDLLKNYDDIMNMVCTVTYSEEGKKEQGEGKMDKNIKKIKIIEDIVEPALEKYNQVIFTGAPGTGKTYSVLTHVKEKTYSVLTHVKEKTENNEERYKFVQFHPSYDYSDFIEGLRPVILKEDGDPTFVKMDGTFKNFCRKVVGKNLDAAIEKIKETMEDEYEKYKDTAELLEKLHSNITYKINNKVELSEVEKAFDDSEEKYYFIIDEINRADLSKTFGEIMFGLEESYRGIQYRFDTQYMNLPTYEVNVENGFASRLEFDCFKNGFFIPRNITIIGTMNDIDRSVESFDFALRRRFQWIEIETEDIMYESLKKIIHDLDENELENLTQNINNMNKNIISKGNYGLSSAFHIGPAYFTTYNNTDSNSLETIFENRIEPLLKEYMRGRNQVADLISECRKALKLPKKEE